MSADYPEIQEMLQQRADIQARLYLMSYDGNPEIKNLPLPDCSRRGTVSNTGKRCAGI